MLPFSVAVGLLVKFIIRNFGNPCHPGIVDNLKLSTGLYSCREIHPLEPQRHRHSMLAPRVCAPRVTRCSLGHVI